eukprot:Nitzschia sp. Nitz4//scaffold119_size111653//61846//62523//NITZ4_004196-RA/size111653-processed-gene-0.190-mRNA-1//-1//CDS//3329533854//6852//frame0
MVPELANTRTLLSGLQSKYPFDESGNSQEESDAELVHGGCLASYLVEHAAVAAGESSRCCEVESLVEILRSLPLSSRDDVLSRVVVDGSQGPFSVYSAPLTVRDPPVSSYKHKQVHHGADVLNLRLPVTGHDMPLHASSPKKGDRANNPSSEPAFFGDFSDANTSATVTSEAVKSVLRKMPDLSFMLESNLVLPKR